MYETLYDNFIYSILCLLAEKAG